MKLYLIRHADALPAGEGGIKEDADRPLSAAGKAQAQAMAKALQQQQVAFDVVLTSPLLRARQTAEEMLRTWPEPPAVQTANGLAIGGKPRHLFGAVRALGKESVALIGHQPDLVGNMGWLIGGKKARLDLAKAGMACIQCEAELTKGEGLLIWLVTPAWYGGSAR